MYRIFIDEGMMGLPLLTSVDAGMMGIFVIPPIVGGFSFFFFWKPSFMYSVKKTQWESQPKTENIKSNVEKKQSCMCSTCEFDPAKYVVTLKTTGDERSATVKQLSSLPKKFTNNRYYKEEKKKKIKRKLCLKFTNACYRWYSLINMMKTTHPIKSFTTS